MKLNGFLKFVWSKLYRRRSWWSRLCARWPSLPPTGRAAVHAWAHLADHFIPHERNGHQPHVLKHRVLVGYSVVLILLKVLAVVAPIVLPSSSLYSSAITNQNIVDLTNQTRENLGLTKLTPNDKLTIAAQAKADDMMLNQYFAHVSPTGRTPWSWITGTGYQYTYAGENLAVNFSSAEGVQAGWMASPTHRANIVQSNYQEIGVGMARGMFQGYDSTVVVEMFGSPVTVLAAARPAPAPAARPAPVVSQPTVAGESTTPVVPKPSPAPVAPAPAPENLPLMPSAPVVYEASFKAVQQPAGYQVEVVVTGASSVTAHYAGNDVSLVQAPYSSTWSGTVPFEAREISQGGDLLSITALGQGGTIVSRSLAWLAPNVSTQHFFTFNEGSDRFAKFFGVFTVHNLQDSVRQFYVYFIVFLAAALLINIFVKIRVQHVSVINHTMLVLALALLLTVV